MNSTDHSEPEDLDQRAAWILKAIDDTPIPAIDATFYAHYFEELRLLVEDLLAQRTRSNAAAGLRAWLVWNCTDLIGCYTTERDAREARADLQQQLCCDYAPDPELLDSITIATAILEPEILVRTGFCR